jgi:hypothetical protein
VCRYGSTRPEEDAADAEAMLAVIRSRLSYLVRLADGVERALAEGKDPDARNRYGSCRSAREQAAELLDRLDRVGWGS